VAKLVAHLLATAVLWVRIQEYKLGDIEWPKAIQLAKKFTKKELLSKNETKPLIPLVCLVIQALQDPPFSSSTEPSVIFFMVLNIQESQ
jgi:hypothetical protein